MKIKTSTKLDEMFQELYECDFEYIDDIFSMEADYYTIPDKSQAEGGVEAGFKLCEKSKRLNKPVWEVSLYTYDGMFTAYFVATLSEVKKIFEKRLDKARKEFKEEEL